MVNQSAVTAVTGPEAPPEIICLTPATISLRPGVTTRLLTEVNAPLWLRIPSAETGVFGDEISATPRVLTGNTTEVWPFAGATYARVGPICCPTTSRKVTEMEASSVALGLANATPVPKPAEPSKDRRNLSPRPEGVRRRNRKECAGIAEDQTRQSRGAAR